MVAAFAKQPFAYWRQHLKTLRGQWAPIQSLLDLATDEQALANDMLFEVETGDGRPLKLVRGPVQFNHTPVNTTRAPQASEHTETFLMEDRRGVGARIEKLQSRRRDRLKNLRGSDEKPGTKLKSTVCDTEVSW